MQFSMAILSAYLYLSICHVGLALKAKPISTNASSLVRINQQLNPGDLVYDFGFFNGEDSRAYCNAGLKVVAVEADASLVTEAHANPKIAPFMQSGQLTLLNYAIAPTEQTTVSTLPFYLNKCTKAWNSFHRSVGCRSCVPPHNEDASSCTVYNLQATPCAVILQTYGSPKYFKLDIEGAEGSCYSALGHMSPQSRPMFISGEVGNDQLLDTFANLGYTGFKLVLQKSHIDSDDHGHSGNWGEGAVDCRAGTQWRSADGMRQELQQLFKKAPNPADPCPPMGVGTVWYDLHASRSPPTA